VPETGLNSASFQPIKFDVDTRQEHECRALASTACFKPSRSYKDRTSQTTKQMITRVPITPYPNIFNPL
jgi:hypothetical protein